MVITEVLYNGPVCYTLRVKPHVKNMLSGEAYGELIIAQGIHVNYLGSSNTRAPVVYVISRCY